MSKNYSLLEFKKMHCLGNDFVIIDGREGTPISIKKIANKIADRRFGIGCDQVVEILTSDQAYAKLNFYNSDGTPSATCGNATRCVARYFMDILSQSSLILETGAGLLACEKVGDLTRVNMGHPITKWDEIPLSEDLDILNLPIEGNPSAIGFGNPHCVFLVDDIGSVDLEIIGPKIENSHYFPQRTNVEFVEVLAPNKIAMIIWERGVGRTQASGSGASAAAAVTILKDCVDKKITICLEGGELGAEWTKDGIWMTGKTSHVFDGVLTGMFGELIDDQ
ncbi:MAG: diaminopimelate epimerase [Rhodobacteraceae bacterium]|nr:diaminopimelate epimerase [Paracoccaceae bacterium]